MRSSVKRCDLKDNSNVAHTLCGESRVLIQISTSLGRPFMLYRVTGNTKSNSMAPPLRCRLLKFWMLFDGRQDSRDFQSKKASNPGHMPRQLQNFFIPRTWRKMPESTEHGNAGLQAHLGFNLGNLSPGRRPCWSFTSM